MSSSITYSSIFSVQSIVIGPATTFGLTLFVTGFYTLLYGLSTYFIIKRQCILNKKLHLAWTTAAFFISSLGALTKASTAIVDATFYYEAVRTRDLGPLEAYSSGSKSQTAMLTLTYVCYIIANCIADAILIQRCYILYGSRKAFLVFLIFLSFSTNAIGIIAAGIRLKAQTSNLINPLNWALFLRGTNLQLGYYCTNAAVNSCFTLLLAGRIWWMGQQAGATLGSATDQRYRTVAAIILESGIIYPIILIVQVALTENTSKIGIPVDFTAIAILMAGIAPTLINVRISIGKSVESTVYQDDSAAGHNSDAGRLGSLRLKHAGSSQTMSEKTGDVEQQGHGSPQFN